MLFSFIRILKQELDHQLVLKKVNSVSKFNQKSWLKSCIGTNTVIRQKKKNDFKNYFFKLMNNAAFVNTMENVRKHRDIKILTKGK